MLIEWVDDNDDDDGGDFDDDDDDYDNDKMLNLDVGDLCQIKVIYQTECLWLSYGFSYRQF